MRGRPTGLALLLLASLAVVACGRSPTADVPATGTIGLTIGAPELEIASVHFDLTGNGLSRSGDIPVAVAGATASAVISGVPVGVGYVMALRGAATDGVTLCEGTAGVDVMANATTPVSVVLACRTPHQTGGVRGSVRFNQCPFLTSLTATPAVMSLGDQEALDLTAAAVDFEHDPLVFSWTAQAGAFEGPTTARASYRCAAPGPVVITVTVSDGQCNDTVAATLVCLPFCGNKPDGTQCNDENACTQVDSCQGGRCLGGAPVTCRALDQCHLAGVCDPANGVCSDPFAADWSVCDDGDLCTQADRCLVGQCLGSNPAVCAAADQCHDAGVCAPTSGHCSSPPRPDGVSCQLPNASSACLAGSCQVSSCAVGWRDCNSAAGDGCETSIATNANCGTCGHVCDGGTNCTAGLCLSPPPTALTAVAGGWKVTLAWNRSAGSISTEVLRATSVGGPFQSIGATMSDTLVDLAVVSGTPYVYVARASSGEGVSGPSLPVTATPLAKQICVGSTSLQSVLVFDAAQTGAAAPLRTLGGSVGTFGSPTAVTSSLTTSELFVMKRGGRIDVYPFLAVGSAAPARSLLLPPPVGISWTLAFDELTGEVATAEYRPANLGARLMVIDGASGMSTRLVNGEASQLGQPASLAIDRRHAEVFVGVTGDSDPARYYARVVSFDTTGGGDVSPRRTLGGPANMDVGGWDIALDQLRDQLYTTCNCDNRITIFERTASGDAAPVRTLLLPPVVTSIYGLLMDEAADTVWVSARAGSNGDLLMEVARGANGNVAPLRAPIELATVGRLSPCN